MALRSEEQVKEYRARKNMQTWVEKDLGRVDRDIAYDNPSGGLDMEIMSLSDDERLLVLALVKQMLEDKYDAITQELEEMLA